MRANAYDSIHTATTVDSVDFRHPKTNAPALIRPIVYATDFSPMAESAAEVVAEFARQLGAPLTLAHPITLPGSLARDREASRLLVASRKSTLHETANSLRETDFDVVESVRPGPADELLAQFAHEQKAQLIVVPSKPRGLRLWPRASLAVRIAGRARTPVLVLRDAKALREWLHGQRRLNVFIAYNFSASADAALRWVKQLTQVGPCEVVLTHVNQPVEDHIRIGARGSLPFGHNQPEVLAVLERDLRARARAILGDMPVRCRIEAGVGRTHSRLMQLAREEGADLIVAGSRQFTGLKRMCHRSLSQALLGKSPVNVAIVPLAHESIGSGMPLPLKRHVLVATDFSPSGNAAVPHALALLPDGGLLTLMHVAPLPRAIGNHVRRELGRDAGLAPADRIAISNRLRALAPPEAAKFGIRVQTEVALAPNAGQAIAQTAERLGVDAICLATNERSEVSRTFLGSVTRTVLELTYRPLLVVPAPRL